jgi:hypothetical protein
MKIRARTALANYGSATVPLFIFEFGDLTMTTSEGMLISFKHKGQKWVWSDFADRKRYRGYSPCDYQELVYRVSSAMGEQGMEAAEKLWSDVMKGKADVH